MLKKRIRNSHKTKDIFKNFDNLIEKKNYLQNVFLIWNVFNWPSWCSRLCLLSEDDVRRPGTASCASTGLWKVCYESQPPYVDQRRKRYPWSSEYLWVSTGYPLSVPFLTIRRQVKFWALFWLMGECKKGHFVYQFPVHGLRREGDKWDKVRIYARTTCKCIWG